jgi:hypothetical protein
MARTQLARRVIAIDNHTNGRLDRFRPFARAVVLFGGEAPTTERVNAVARWYANGGRRIEH